ncbi:hypothetical protein V2J09_009644 [Rumex salicifolius]
MEMEDLRERAAFLKESLLKSQSITDSMIRTLSIRRAQENIDKSLKQSEVILYRLDLSHQAEIRILKGPHEDLESYLQAIDQLRSNVKFFSNANRFKINNAAQIRANNLLSKAIAKLGDEFKNLLALYREIRSATLELSLTKLGLEALTDNDLQKMPWEVLETKIGSWIQYIRIAIESTFSSILCTGVRESAAGLTKRLAHTAQQIFSEFEVAVEKDATKSAVSDGTVHPLSSYVINYTKSNVKELLGDDWVHIHRRVVQQHANKYKRIAWSKILQHITVSGELSKARIRDRFKIFNTEFKELHQRQSQWSVPDGELHESLTLAIAEVDH